MNRKQMTLRNSNVLMLSLVVLLAGTGVTLADVRLPAIIGDNMVLQQGRPVSVWGWADPGEEVMVSVSWHGMSWAVTAGQNGNLFFQSCVFNLQVGNLPLIKLFSFRCQFLPLRY